MPVKTVDEAWKCNASTRNTSSFHISGLGLPAHDMNAIFLWKKTWHVMHQGNGNWRHLISSDLVRWTRVPDALAGRGSYDGALTILDNEGPVILFDCRGVADCLPPNSPVPVGTGSGDPPIVGVARPADSTDPLLVGWTKDAANPITIKNSAAPYSGPSNMWRSASGKLQMKMIQMNSSGWTTGLYEATGASLHSWRLVDPAFYPSSSGGGGIFYELPASTVIGATDLTHIMGMGGAFALGKVDATSGKFTVSASTANLAVDSYNTVLYTMLGVAEGRIITMGWVPAGPMKRDVNGDYRTSGPDDCLTVPRELRYDAANSQLLAMPVAELTALRGKLLGSHAQAALLQGTSLTLLDTDATAFDLELLFELAASEAIAVDVALLASGPQAVDGGLIIGINISAPAAAADRRTVSLTVSGKTVLAFAMPPGERSLSVRALADRNVAEVFVGDGRGAYTSAVNISSVTAAGAFLTAHLPVTLTNASAWAMDCGVKAGGALGIVQHGNHVVKSDDTEIHPVDSMDDLELPSEHAFELTFFVSCSQGDDGTAGSLAAPFRSLGRARDAIRAARKQSQEATEAPAAVFIRAGVCELAMPLELNAQDSSVTWSAYQGESVLVSAGLTVPDKLTSVRGSTKIVTVSLTDLNLTANKTGVLRPRGFPGGPGGIALWRFEPSAMELFWRQPSGHAGKASDGTTADAQMVLARYPDLKEPGKPSTADWDT